MEKLFEQAELATIGIDEAERRIMDAAAYAFLMIRQLQHAKRLQFRAYDVAALVEANLQTALRGTWQTKETPPAAAESTPAG